MSHTSFDLVALDVHDVYILNDHGVELKAKAPPLIGHVMFWILICHQLYIRACDIYYVGHHVHMHL